MTITVTREHQTKQLQAAIKTAAMPWQPQETVKAILHRAARVLGIPGERLRNLYYGRSYPEWCEAETIFLKAEQHRAKEAARVRMEWEFIRTDAAQAALSGRRDHARRRLAGLDVGSTGALEPVGEPSFF